MLARWWTFGVWALVAGSAFFWGLRIFVQAPAAPRDTLVAQPGGELRGDLTRLFGVDAPPTAVAEAPVAEADPRFTLVGVVSPRSAAAAREGVALIAIDGNPARAYRVGTVVDGDTVLQGVQARGVQLGPRGGPALVALELPPLPPPATGTLPSIGGPGTVPGMTPGVPPGVIPRVTPGMTPGVYRPMPPTPPPGAPVYNPPIQSQPLNTGQPQETDTGETQDSSPQVR